MLSIGSVRLAPALSARRRSRSQYAHADHNLVSRSRGRCKHNTRVFIRGAKYYTYINNKPNAYIYILYIFAVFRNRRRRSVSRVSPSRSVAERSITAYKHRVLITPEYPNFSRAKWQNGNDRPNCRPFNKTTVIRRR